LLVLECLISNRWQRYQPQFDVAISRLEAASTHSENKGSLSLKCNWAAIETVPYAKVGYASIPFDFVGWFYYLYVRLENRANRKNGKEKVGKNTTLEESLLVIRYWLMEKKPPSNKTVATSVFG